jgi:hypothetical protein
MIMWEGVGWGIIIVLFVSISQVYAFSIYSKGMTAWEKFDWKKVTTVVPVGYNSSDLMCLAHENGARVIQIGTLNSLLTVKIAV